MDFSSQLQTVSEDVLNSLFADEPTPTPTPANNKVDDTDSKKDDVKTDVKTDDIPFIENVDDIKTDDDTDDKTDDSDEKKEDTVNIDEVKTVLKNTTNFLIEKGIWSDFEGREELELDEETYAQLSLKQAEEQVNELFSELLDSTGDYGKAIISHIKNGGNPDEIIDIFKEQKQIENIDIKNPANAESLIEKYYTDVVGWSDAKVKRYLDTLKAEEDGISNEAVEVQQKFEEIYNEQLKEITAQQEKEKREREIENQKYLSKLSETIDSFEEFTDEDKKIVKNSVFKASKKVNGVPVNEFFAKFYEIQKDPKQYIKLVHFVMAPERYEGKIESKQQKNITAKQWNFVKGNAAVKNTNIQSPKDAAKTSKLDFSGIVFNKK